MTFGLKTTAPIFVSADDDAIRETLAALRGDDRNPLDVLLDMEQDAFNAYNPDDDEAEHSFVRQWVRRAVHNL